MNNYSNIGHIFSKKNVDLYASIHSKDEIPNIKEFLENKNYEKIFSESMKNIPSMPDMEFALKYAKENNKEIVHIGYDFLDLLKKLAKNSPTEAVIYSCQKGIGEIIESNPNIKKFALEQNLNNLLVNSVDKLVEPGKKMKIYQETEKYFDNNLDYLSSLNKKILKREKIDDISPKDNTLEDKLIAFGNKWVQKSDEIIWEKINKNLDKKSSAIIVGFLHGPCIKKKLSERLKS